MTALRPPGRGEVGHSLAGVFRILEGDGRGINLIDTSVNGTLRSFLVFVWCWPAQAFLWTGLWREVPEGRPETLAGMIGFFLVASLFDFLSWVLPALVLYPVSGLFGFRGRFLVLVAAGNWFSLVATYIGFLPGAVAYLLPVSAGFGAILALMAYGLTLGLYFRLARIVLNGEALLGALVTLIMLVSTLLVSSAAFRTLGF